MSTAQTDHAAEHTHPSHVAHTKGSLCLSASLFQHKTCSLLAASAQHRSHGCSRVMTGSAGSSQTQRCRARCCHCASLAATGDAARVRIVSSITSSIVRRGSRKPSSALRVQAAALPDAGRAGKNGCSWHYVSQYSPSRLMRAAVLVSLWAWQSIGDAGPAGVSTGVRVRVIIASLALRKLLAVAVACLGTGAVC